MIPGSPNSTKKVTLGSSSYTSLFVQIAGVTYLYNMERGGLHSLGDTGELIAKFWRLNNPSFSKQIADENKVLKIAKWIPFYISFSPVYFGSTPRCRLHQGINFYMRSKKILLHFLFNTHKTYLRHMFSDEIDEESLYSVAYIREMYLKQWPWWLRGHKGQNCCDLTWRCLGWVVVHFSLQVCKIVHAHPPRHLANQNRAMENA